MCLTTTNIEPKTSNHNIEVYKIVQSDLSSVFNPKFKYKVGVLMNDDAVEDVSSGFKHYFIKSGYLHSFKSLLEAENTLKHYNDYNKYHKINIKYDIYKAEIPAGTKFLEGVYNQEICSKSLKLIQKM